MSILESLSSAKDIANICCLDHNIRSTALSILSHVELTTLSFAFRSRLKSKNLMKEPFDILSWHSLTCLDLSETGITAAFVRTLLMESKSLRILLIVDCKKIGCASLISLLRAISKLRFGKRELPREAFAPLVVLDCWGISGLSLDYKYQNKQEWLYESCCADNKNLQTLLTESELLGIDLNTTFCTSTDHDAITDIRYHPAARQTCGLTACELSTFEYGSLCDTCILRHHNKLGNPEHACRTLTRPKEEDAMSLRP